MKFEYMVLYVSQIASGSDKDDLQDRLNELAMEDWRVIVYCPQGLILVRETPGSLSARVAQAIAIERMRQAPVDATWVVAPEPTNAKEN